MESGERWMEEEGGSASSPSHVDRLLELTTCNICSKSFEEPRYLPCHHSFCTKCIQRLMNSSSETFLCPIDRKPVKIPPHGVQSFEHDTRALELQSIRNDLRHTISSTNIQRKYESSVADIDLNLEWLSSAIKDVEHSSCVAQHEVHTLFAGISKRVKDKEDEILNEIERACSRHIQYMEYEKYRLIQMKKTRNGSFLSTGDGLEDDTRKVCGLELEVTSCDIGHQSVQFHPDHDQVEKLNQSLQNVGHLALELGLNIKFRRDLSKMDQYPYGIQLCLTNELEAPKGVCRCGAGRTYIANSGKNELMILDHNYNMHSTIPGEDGLRFKSVANVAVFDEKIYVADPVACQIVLLSCEGEVIKRFGRLGTGPLELNSPSAVCVNSKGKVYVADPHNQRIQVLSSTLQKCKQTVTSVVTSEKMLMNFAYPCGVCVDREDNVYICDTNNRRIIVVPKEGKSAWIIQPTGLLEPVSVQVTSDKKLLIVDRTGCRVLICDKDTGVMVSQVLGVTTADGDIIPFQHPFGVVVDGTDKIMITDVILNSILMI